MNTYNYRELAMLRYGEATAYEFTTYKATIIIITQKIYLLYNKVLTTFII